MNRKHIRESIYIPRLESKAKLSKLTFGLFLNIHIEVVGLSCAQFHPVFAGEGITRLIGNKKCVLAEGW